MSIIDQFFENPGLLPALQSYTTPKNRIASFDSECVYDARLALHNSFDSVSESDGSKKSLFANLIKLYMVSKDMLEFDMKQSCYSSNLPYLEICVERKWKPEEIVKYELDEFQSAASGDTPPHTIERPLIYSSQTTYWLNYPHLQIRGQLPDDPNSWKSDDILGNIIPTEFLNVKKLAVSTHTQTIISAAHADDKTNAGAETAALGEWETETIDELYLSENFTPVSMNPKDWKCMVCGKTGNLWLNLSDG